MFHHGTVFKTASRPTGATLREHGSVQRLELTPCSFVTLTLDTAVTCPRHRVIAAKTRMLFTGSPHSHPHPIFDRLWTKHQPSTSFFNMFTWIKRQSKPLR